MPETETYPLLHFREPFETVAWEVSAKGYYGGVTVELEDGSRYSVYFYEPVRLAQDLESEVESGGACIAEPGMIIIPEINEENIRRAIKELNKEGWFNQMVSIKGAA